LHHILYNNPWSDKVLLRVIEFLETIKNNSEPSLKNEVRDQAKKNVTLVQSKL
jgi:hypothetical protein